MMAYATLHTTTTDSDTTKNTSILLLYIKQITIPYFPYAILYWAIFYTLYIIYKEPFMQF